MLESDPEVSSREKWTHCGTEACTDSISEKTLSKVAKRLHPLQDFEIVYPLGLVLEVVSVGNRT